MKKNIAEFTRLIVLSCVCLTFSLICCAAQPSARLVPRLKGYLTSPYGYWEYLPENYHQNTRLPVVIYLHGIKETGSGETVAELDKVARNGVPHIIRKFERNFPFILIAPQSPGIEEGFGAEQVLEFIRIIQSNYNIDDERIYLTGVSYGAYAALRLASVTPDKFAAVVPFSSCGGENDLHKLKDVPMWAFANIMDKQEVPECMEELIERIREHGGTPLLTLYRKKGHNAWERTYKSDFMWDWLLKQKKIRSSENQPPILINPGNMTVGVGASALYTLMVSDANNDSLRFYIEGPVTKGSRFINTKNGHAKLMMNTLFPGVFNIAICVEDGRGGVSRQSFWLQTSYTLLLYPYFLIFLFQPFIVELPLSILLLFPVVMQLLATHFLSLIAHFFYWLSVLILVVS